MYRSEQLNIIRRLSEAVSHALDLQEIYSQAIDALRETLGADRSSILLFDPDGVMRFKAWRGLSDSYRAATEGHSPWTRETRDPQPVFVENVEQDEELAPLRDVIAAEGIRALGFIPLLYQGRLLGKFMIYYNAPHSFSEEESQLAQTIAGYIAFSIERKRSEDEKALLLTQVQDERQRLESIVSSVPGVVWEAWGKPDEESQRVNFVSAYVEEMLGYTREDWLTTPNFWLTIVHPDDREEAARVARAKFTSGRGGPNRFRWVTRDGRALWVEAQSVVIKDAAGNPVGMRGVTMDISERVQAEEERSDLLAAEQAARAKAEEAEQRLASVANALDRALTESELLNAITKAASGEDDLNRILESTLNRLGKLISFTGGSIALVENQELVVCAAVGPFSERAMGARMARGKGRSWQVVETGEPFVSGDLTAEGFKPTSPIRSYLAVPLVWRGRAFGLLEIDSTEPNSFKASDADLLSKVAAALSGPIELARRYTAEVHAAQRAEAAQLRLALLAEVSSVLAGSLDYETTLQSVARLVVPHLADLCIVDLALDGSGIRKMAAAHMDPAREGLVRELQRNYAPNLDSPHPVARVLRAGKPEIVSEVPDSYLREIARDEEHYRLLRELGYGSYMVVPLQVRGRTLGTISLITGDSGRHYGPDDLSLAEELARRAALAIESARLYREAQEAARLERQHAAQLRGLAEAALAINSALSIDDMLVAITEQARRIIGAHRAFTSLVAGKGWEQAVHTVSLSEKYEPWRSRIDPPDGEGLYAIVCDTNRPLRLTQKELEAHPEWHGPGSLGEQAEDVPPVRGWLAAPLVGRDGRNLGLVQLSDAYEGQFSEQDEAVLVQLSQMASVAIENAWLYRDEQEAVRAREELLSIVSHDLKNPLGNVKMLVQLLQRRIARGEVVEQARLTNDLQRIDRQVTKMNMLINELLDFAHLQVGQALDLDRQSSDLVSLARQVAAEADQGNDPPRVRVQTELPELLGFWDSDRVERAISNLVSNALKYSPNGTGVLVELSVEEGGNWAVVSVRDQGVGIPAVDLPYIFDWFRRAGNVAGHIRGTGVGLAGARQIIEQHGGSISVESEEGVGSTFTVRLPLNGAVPVSSLVAEQTG